MKQHEAVRYVMEKNGGRATLAYLYEHALHVPNTQWGTKTPDATIRRIVQKHEWFYRIRAGEWGLVTHRDQFEPEVNNVDKTHSFYQGLLVEIGNWKNLKSYIPAQDQNREFQTGRTLKELATTIQIPEFTYETILKKVKSIDVIWFNGRGFPDSVIEVEHSTDMTKSLVKFMELQDFTCEMIIAADAKRKEFFKQQTEFSAYVSIKNRVKFWDYERIAETHSALAKLTFYNRA